MISSINPGAHIVFVCERCDAAKLTMPADNHLSIASAYERLQELNWTLRPGHGAVDGLVVCPSCSKGTKPTDEIARKPRRRIVVLARLEADDWSTLQGSLRHLETEIVIHGQLPASSVSGGYSSSHIIVSSEDGTIDHDSWARELNEHLEKLAAADEAKAKPFITQDGTTIKPEVR